MSEQGPTPALSGAQPSKCAEESRAAQLARIRAMTPKERMALALELGRRHRQLEAARAGLRPQKP